MRRNIMASSHHSLEVKEINAPVVLADFSSAISKLNDEIQKFSHVKDIFEQERKLSISNLETEIKTFASIKFGVASTRVKVTKAPSGK